jgi:RimJ/RimL family protein N-acetyltransferase
MFCRGDVGFRPIEEKDLEKIRALRNAPSTWEMLGGIDHVTPDQQLEWYKNLGRIKDQAYYTAFINIIDPYDGVWSTEGDFLGVIRQTEIDLQNRSCLIGLDIDPIQRNQGWATKLYAALLKWLFDYRNFHRVALLVLDTNEVGKKLYFNAGFKLEGKHREAIFRNGRFVDYLAMSILEDEYRAAQ